VSIRMTDSIKGRLVTMSALRPPVLVRGETDVRSLRDVRSEILERRDRLDCGGVPCVHELLVGEV
jgi:hypothetical protein